MSVVFANNAATTLAAAITSTSATTITVTSSSSFPSISGSEYFYATIDDGTNKEIVKVTGVSSETWTIVRAQDGTSARTFANGIDVELRNNAAMLSDIKSHFSLADNEILNIGAGNDLQIKHDGSDSFIDVTGTGHLYIRNTTDDRDIIFQSDDQSGGNATYFMVDGSTGLIQFQKDLFILDSVIAKFGSSSDLEISHGGTDSYITNNTGDFYITNKADDKDIILRSDDGSGGFTEYFRLDGSQAQSRFLRNVKWDDSVNALFGTNDDLQLFHDGSNSYVSQQGTGNLIIRTTVDDADILLQSDDGSGGIATYLQLDGSAENSNFLKDALFTDNVKALFGTSSDLQIYHDGSNSYIADTGTGNLRVDATNFYVRNSAGTELKIGAIDDGAVDLYYDGSKKFETTSSGVSVTGGLTTSGASTIDELTVSNDATLSGGADFAGDATFGDSIKAKFGSAGDLEIFHNGSNSVIKDGGTGHLYLQGTNLLLTDSAGYTFIECIDSGNAGTVKLYHSASEKLATTSSGVSVTGAATGTLTTDNDGSFDMAASNNFKCTPSGNFTLTFTNIVSQSGNILLINSGGHTVSAHTNSKVDANLLATVSTAGTYLISYFSDGTNVYLTNSAIYT